jgi:hypothetical protein
MPERAFLEVLDSNFQPLPGSENRVDVHFNPQSLQVNYHVFGTDGNKQRVNQGVKQGSADDTTGSISDVSMDLLFDTTETDGDVRNITNKFAAMIRPGIKKGKTAPEVPKVRFTWGTFMFVGKLSSLSETIDFFSERGIPLRATVKLTLLEIQRERGEPGALGGAGASGGIGLSGSVGISAGIGGGAGFSASASLNAGINVGTTPLTLAQAGDSLQALTGRAGIDASWKAVAAANNIDNPRSIPPGTPLNLNVGVSASAAASAGVSGISGAGASASANAGASANF